MTEQKIKTEEKTETSISLSGTLQSYLKKIFGFSTFKGNQEPVMKSIISGHDTFVIMPTGGGKSLCYQLPAIAGDGTAIIISPLIALMKNQVDHIRSFQGDDGVAHFLNSSLSRKEIKKVKEDLLVGKTKIVYLAPETLTKPEMLDFLQKVNISFVAVDEAHCISEWGHDFRPEYRRIRTIVQAIGRIPIMALTASATPKVQEDITKNLEIEEANVFKSSFNRPNLYYEVRPKYNQEQTLKEILTFLQGHKGKSGIIYCLSRKKTETVAESLRVNGIKALAYHAGMDSATRGKHQDQFLMEDVDVIVATIAFGMGIDKPDVRFIIHYDVPKSIESYYQETGRAGRDGNPATCLLFYNYNDLTKLEKFLKDKPFTEREVGSQLLQEMGAFCESSTCRRKGLMHYFGEDFEVENCEKTCDNCRYPKETFDAQKEVKLALKTLIELNSKFTIEYLIDLLIGNKNQKNVSYGHDKLPTFGKGQDRDFNFWKSVIRQAMLADFIKKDIESYGTLKIGQKGLEFIKASYPFYIALDQDYSQLKAPPEESYQNAASYDELLYNMLKELRKKVASEKGLPPYIIFQEPSLEEMAIKYPVNFDELAKISGIGNNKAQKFGGPFLELINKYVEENNIERPDDFVMKSVVNKSKTKVHIIRSIDRKMSLEDIARANSISMEDLIEEIEHIVYSGTKVDISYYLDTIVDPEYQEEIFEHFKESETDSVDVAVEELGSNLYSYEEIRLVRIRFISELAN